MREQGRSINCSSIVKYADEQREKGEIFQFQEGMEEVEVTREKDSWEHKGNPQFTRQLYIIREGKEGSDYAYFSLGMDERAAKIRHLIGETIGVFCGGQEARRENYNI